MKIQNFKFRLSQGAMKAAEQLTGSTISELRRRPLIDPKVAKQENDAFEKAFNAFFENPDSAKAQAGLRRFIIRKAEFLLH